MSFCTVHKVIENAKWKVRCLAMYYNLIFVGCSDGSLRIFAPFQRTKNKNSIEYECIKTERLNFKQILQFEIIEYVDLLIVVMDDNVFFYSLYSAFEVGNALMDESVVRFDINLLFECGDLGRGTVIVTCSKAWSDGLKKKLFIAFGKKRSISVFQWKGSVASNLKTSATVASHVLKKYNSYPIPDKPRLLILSGKTMFIGFREQYDLIHLETSSKQKIFGTGRRCRDSIGIRLINKEVLLMVDKKGYFVNYEAKPTRSKCIEWSEIPLNLSYFHPFIISILPKSIEIHHLSTSSLIHKIDFKNGKFSNSQSYKNGLIWNSFICIGSSSDIISINDICIGSTLKYLCNNLYFQEALETIKMYQNEAFICEGIDRETMRKHILEYYGYHLFNKSQWKLSVDKFISSSICSRRIISLFPTLVPCGQCIMARQSHPVNFQNVCNLDSTFKSAVNEFLIPYLKLIKSSIEYQIDDNNSGEWPLIELIDTVYCKCLIQVDGDLTSFLSCANQCNVSECQLLLKQSKKFRNLVLLYESHNEHKCALDLMRIKNKQINGIDKSILYLQKLGNDAIHSKLILHFSEWVFKEDPNQGLRIFADIHDGHFIRPNIACIKVVDHLERIKVPIPTRIAYLELIIFEGNESDSIFHDDLIKLYLFELFSAMKEQQIEDDLSRSKYGMAQGDIVQLTEAFSLGKYGWVQPGTEARVSKVTPTPNHSIQVYVTFPETNTLGVVPRTQLKLNQKRHRIRPKHQEGKVGDLRRKLIKFLKTSHHFIPTNVKNLFPKQSLLEEQAWLRSQIPQHKEALNIIIYQIKDAEMAKEYAQQIYKQFNEKLNENKLNKNKLLNDPKWIEAEKIYLTLLDVYLTPPITDTNMADALNMLRQNHNRIDPIAVFNKLPQNIKVSNTLKYMEAVFKSCFEKKRELQVKKNLLKQATLKLSLRKHGREQAFQRINQDTKCNKCNKRIGQAAFVRYPDQNVFHYVCVQVHSSYNSITNTLLSHDLQSNDIDDDDLIPID